MYKRIFILFCSLANKQDLGNALGENEITAHLDIEQAVNVNHCPSRVVSVHVKLKEGELTVIYLCNCYFTDPVSFGSEHLYNAIQNKVMSQFNQIKQRLGEEIFLTKFFCLFTGHMFCYQRHR